MADVVFSPAHKVVIDCVTYLVAQIHDSPTTRPDRDLVLDALAEALPRARSTENAVLDAVILVAIELMAAAKARRDGAQNWSMQWCSARANAGSVVARFAFSRLAISAEKFRETLEKQGAV